MLCLTVISLQEAHQGYCHPASIAGSDVDLWSSVSNSHSSPWSGHLVHILSNSEHTAGVCVCACVCVCVRVRARAVCDVVCVCTHARVCLHVTLPGGKLYVCIPVTYLYLQVCCTALAGYTCAGCVRPLAQLFFTDLQLTP